MEKEEEMANPLTSTLYDTLMQRIFPLFQLFVESVAAAASDSRRARRNDKLPRSRLWRTSESRCADIV
jgi:hypothetical protein